MIFTHLPKPLLSKIGVLQNMGIASIFIKDVFKRKQIYVLGFV